MYDLGKPNISSRLFDSEEMQRINEIALSNFSAPNSINTDMTQCFDEVLFAYLRNISENKEIQAIIESLSPENYNVSYHETFDELFGNNWIIFFSNFKDENVGKQLIKMILEQYVDNPSKRAIEIGYAYAERMADDMCISDDCTLQRVIDGINYPYDGTDIFECELDNGNEGIQDWFFPLGLDDWAEKFYNDWYNEYIKKEEQFESSRYADKVKELTYRWLAEQYEAGSIESEGAMLLGPYYTLEDFERAFRAEDDDFQVILEGQYEEGVRYIGTEIDSNEDDTFRMQSLPSVIIQWCDGTKWHLFKLEK